MHFLTHTHTQSHTRTHACTFVRTRSLSPSFFPPSILSSSLLLARSIYPSRFPPPLYISPSFSFFPTPYLSPLSSEFSPALFLPCSNASFLSHLLSIPPFALSPPPLPLSLSHSFIPPPPSLQEILSPLPSPQLQLCSPSDHLLSLLPVVPSLLRHMHQGTPHPSCAPGPAISSAW